MTERAPTGSLEELREIATEQLDLVSFHARLAAEQGTVSADAGMAYNCRRAVAHIRMAVDVLRMLRERQEAEAEAAQARRPDSLLLGTERRGEAA